MATPTLYRQLKTIEDFYREYPAKAREKIAKAKDTPAASLALLAEDKDSLVAWYVAENLNCNEKVFRILLDRESKENETSEIYSRDLQITSRVARNLSLPLKLQKELANSPIRLYRMVVSANKNLDLKLIRQLSAEKECLRILAKNPATPEDILQTILNDSDKKELWEDLAQNPKLPISFFPVLAEKGNKTTRWLIAQCPKTPSEVLHDLVADEEINVRQAVAINRHTPLGDVKNFLSDKDSWVRSSALLNPSLPLEELEKLSDTKDIDIMRHILTRRNLSVAILKKAINFRGSFFKGDLTLYVYKSPSYKKLVAEGKIIPPVFNWETGKHDTDWVFDLS